MLLLGLRHHRQQAADCLVSCATIVLEYMGVAATEQRLRRLLGTTEDGTPFFNIRQLTTFGVYVDAGRYGNRTMFERSLEVGLPVIVGVDTLNWSHWGGRVTGHAVVVVGIDSDHERIYIHDPILDDGPLEMPLIDFEIGWEEKQRPYAVIHLAPP